MILPKISGRYTYEARELEDGRFGVCRVEWLGEDLTYSDYEEAKAVAENIGISDSARISKETMMKALDGMDGVSVSKITEAGHDNEKMNYARTIIGHYMLESGYSMTYIASWMKRPSLRRCIIEARYEKMHCNLTYPEFNAMEREFLEKISLGD